MYQPRYVSLSGGLGLVAKRLAESTGLASAADDGRGQLIEALYEGTVRAQGTFWELVAPDDTEPESPIPPAKTTIPCQYWKNKKYKSDLPLLTRTSIWATNTHTHRDGQVTTILDAVKIEWGTNSISWEDDAGDFYRYEDIELLASDLDRAFPAPTNIEGAAFQAPAPHSEDRTIPPIDVTYSTGAAGRPSTAG